MIYNLFIWYLGACSCGECGYQDRDCAFYLDLLCKHPNGIKDPNYEANECATCPHFKIICGTICNYCPEPVVGQTATTTTSTSTTSVNRGSVFNKTKYLPLIQNLNESYLTRLMINQNTFQFVKVMICPNIMRKWSAKIGLTMKIYVTTLHVTVIQECHCCRILLIGWKHMA